MYIELLTKQFLYFRKFYFLDRGASVGDPDMTFITVPNIPFFTGMHKIRKSLFLAIEDFISTIQIFTTFTANISRFEFLNSFLF